MKTRVATSPIHGLGLFADQFIPRGAPVWKFVSGFDRTFTREEIETFPESVQILLARHAYLSKKTHRYLLDIDYGKYFNHSKTPNTATIAIAGEEEDVICALRDIAQGEEITVDYDNQEEAHVEGNILDSFWEKYHLSDEIDPRIKKESVGMG